MKKPAIRKTVTTRKSQYDKLHFVLAGACLFFGGAFFGGLAIDLFGNNDYISSQKPIRIGGETFVSVKNISDNFRVSLGSEGEFAVFENKTWIPVPGRPVEVIVLSDATCGDKCNDSSPIAGLRQTITPALLVRKVDVAEEEGKKLISSFGITTIPQFFLGAGIEEIKNADGKSFVEVSSEVITKKNGLYKIDGEKVGVWIGKFLSQPKFLDIAIEPTKGESGKVRVVEFTDYQCPYCKRLHDKNKDLILNLDKVFIVEDDDVFLVTNMDFNIDVNKHKAQRYVTQIQTKIGDKTFSEKFKTKMSLDNSLEISIHLFNKVQPNINKFSDVLKRFAIVEDNLVKIQINDKLSLLKFILSFPHTRQDNIITVQINIPTKSHETIPLFIKILDIPMFVNKI